MSNPLGRFVSSSSTLNSNYHSTTQCVLITTKCFSFSEGAHHILILKSLMLSSGYVGMTKFQ